MVIKDDGMVSKLLKDTALPRMFHAQQSFERPVIKPEDIPETAFRLLNESPCAERVKPGMTIAITAGSRGIANVAIITKTVVDWVKSKGATPFIVPAMGSHGGATAEGQLEVLEGYGITPETMGCEIRSSMETVFLGIGETGRPVYMDKNAYSADGVILSCRLKPHNAFRGKVESGPCKMMAIGLGKQKGAESTHFEGMGKIGLNIIAAAKVFLEKANILFAFPCLENAYDETAMLVPIPAEDILTVEPELLKQAFKYMPSLLVNETDVLVVEKTGKNFSGTGVDPNITGTFSTEFATGGIKVQRTCFLDLTDESHGNALGVGLANCITKKFYEKINPDIMYPNCITSTVLASARIPCVVATDKEAVQLCIRTTNGVDKAPEKIRVVQIPNSLHIGEIMLSESYYEDVCAGKYPGVKAISEPADWHFSENGELEDHIKQ